MKLVLKSTTAVIEALGGVRAVADLTNRTYQAAHNWKRFKTFPPDTYLVMKAKLDEIGATAPASLWRMVKPRRLRLPQRKQQVA